MNKIILDGEVYTVKHDINCIEVKKDSTLYINTDKDIHLDIKIDDNVTLTIFDFNKDRENTKIEVTQNNNSKINYYHGLDIDKLYNFKYRAYINGNNNVNNIYIHGISRGSVTIDVDEIIDDKTSQNEVLEEIKILTDGGKALVLPKISVNTLNVFAEHKTTISNIRDDVMFYLNSKGIDSLDAKKLIIDSYRYGLFKDNEEFINIIKK